MRWRHVLLLAAVVTSVIALAYAEEGTSTDAVTTRSQRQRERAARRELRRLRKQRKQQQTKVEEREEAEEEDKATPEQINDDEHTVDWKTTNATLEDLDADANVTTPEPTINQDRSKMLERYVSILFTIRCIVINSVLHTRGERERG